MRHQAFLLSLAFSASFCIYMASPANAHHLGNDVDDDILPLPPVVQPHFEPPPAPPPPVNPLNAAPTLIPVAPTSTILPTDVSGMGGPLGRASILKGLLGGKSQDKSSSFKTPRDERFSFSGSWLSLESDPEDFIERNNERLEAKGASLSSSQKGHVTFNAYKKKGEQSPLFMPTDKAHYTRVTNNEIQVQDGAVLVKPGKRPVYVSTEMKGRKILTKVGKGSIALVSKMDDKATVVNLTDCKCGSCVMCCCATDESKSVSVPVQVGQIAELCSSEKGAAGGNYVTSRVLAEHKVNPGLQLKVGRCHYIATIRRFNLDKALPKEDLDKIVKTAAATLYAQRVQSQ